MIGANSTINFPIRWHQRFRHFDLGDQGTLLLSEDSEYLLSRDDYQRLNAVTEREGYLYDFLSSDMGEDGHLDDGGIGDQIHRLKKIDEWVREEIIDKKAPPRDTKNTAQAYYTTPQFEAEEDLVLYKGLPLYTLSVLPLNRVLKSELFALCTEIFGSLRRHKDTGDHEVLSYKLKNKGPWASYPAIVLVDDYLDPRLISLHRKLAIKQQPWFLLKLTGETHLLGPLFGSAKQHPDQASTPPQGGELPEEIDQQQKPSVCIPCLQSILTRNKPVREWLRRQTESPHHPPLRCLVDSNGSLRTLRMWKDAMLKPGPKKSREEYNSSQYINCLYQVSTAPLATATERSETKITRHTFHNHSRPCCSGQDASITCAPGNIEKTFTPPMYLSHQRPEPSADQNQHHHTRQSKGALNYTDTALNTGAHANIRTDNSTDGGYREISRQATLDKLMPLIDPLTGYINELVQISPDGNPGDMAVYRASYFQNSFQTDEMDADTFVQLSLGKGVSREQAKASALGEALERQAAQYLGDEKTLFARPEDLPHRAYLPQQLSPFSEQQYQWFTQYQKASLHTPQWVEPYDQNTAIHWYPCWSLRDAQPCYAPAAYCFANTPFDDHKYSLYHHNGNSAGNTREEAILQGLLEVIERDAVAIWWYNQVPRPAIDPSVIPTEQRASIDASLGDWEYWILDISHDIDVVSCVAVGQHRESKSFALGFGCHIEPGVACARALTEMYQLIQIKDQVTGPFDFDAIEALPYLFPKRNTAKKMRQDFSFFNRASPRRTAFFSGIGAIINSTIEDEIVSLVKGLATLGFDTCIADYSRSGLPLKTLKVIVPGLCHFWPQLDNPRLFQLPASLGWLSKPLAPQDRNPLDLYL